MEYDKIVKSTHEVFVNTTAILSEDDIKKCKTIRSTERNRIASNKYKQSKRNEILLLSTEFEETLRRTEKLEKRDADTSLLIRSLEMEQSELIIKFLISKKRIGLKKHADIINDVSNISGISMKSGPF